MDAFTGRLYVDKKLTTGANDGLSWGSAFRGSDALQKALDTAEAINFQTKRLVTVQIWVAKNAPGQPYTPTKPPYSEPLDPRSKTFEVTWLHKIELYGGFNGSETNIDQRDISANETILSGDLAGDDASRFINYKENAYHVLLLHSETTVDGFTIEHGCANAINNDDSRGAGIFIENEVDLHVRSCTFLDNYASNGFDDPYSQYGLGAGISAYGTACVSDINSCNFIGNYATQGGAIEAQGTITNCSFYGNEARYGAAIVPGGMGLLAVSNCEFFNNTADVFGGVMFLRSQGYSTKIINCTMDQNHATNNGGSICNMAQAPEITNSILWGSNIEEIYNANSGYRSTISYSDIHGSGGSGIGWNSSLGVDGGHNKDIDPQFTANRHLLATSECIDAGDDAQAPPLDKSGNARIDIAGAGETGTLSDMGAYERQ
jgi:predicted outer membrane repeat protein